MAKESKIKDVSTARHATRYVLVGITIAGFNYLAYQLIARFLIKGSDLLWLSNLIATTLAVFVAYFLHSRITWKERNPGRAGIIRFFIWNAALALAISPGLTWFFGLFHPLYDFAHGIVTTIGLPFDHDFTESTGIFVLANIVIMVINFLFYDKFVFGKSKSTTEPNPESKTNANSNSKANPNPESKTNINSKTNPESETSHTPKTSNTPNSTPTSKSKNTPARDKSHLDPKDSL